MEEVRSWCGQPSDRGRLKNRITLALKCTMLEPDIWDRQKEGRIAAVFNATNHRAGAHKQRHESQYIDHDYTYAALISMGCGGVRTVMNNFPPRYSSFSAFRFPVFHNCATV